MKLLDVQELHPTERGDCEECDALADFAGKDESGHYRLVCRQHLQQICAHCGHDRSAHTPGTIYTAELPTICEQCCCYQFEDVCSCSEREKRHPT